MRWEGPHTLQGKDGRATVLAAASVCHIPLFSEVGIAGSGAVGVKVGAEEEGMKNVKIEFDLGSPIARLTSYVGLPVTLGISGCEVGETVSAEIVNGKVMATATIKEEKADQVRALVTDGHGLFAPRLEMNLEEIEVHLGPVAAVANVCEYCGAPVKDGVCYHNKGCSEKRAVKTFIRGLIATIEQWSGDIDTAIALGEGGDSATCRAYGNVVDYLKDELKERGKE